MAKEVSLKVPEDVYIILEILAKNNKKKPADYLSYIIRESSRK